MSRANALPTPIPASKEYRALEQMKHFPAGCVLFPVMDDDSDPHLRRGETAIVDITDREPQHGEVM
jgi:hypothetical protein